MCPRLAGAERHRRGRMREPESLVGVGLLLVIYCCSVVGDRQTRVGLPQTRIKVEGLGKKSPREMVSGWRVHKQNPPANKEIVCFDARCSTAGEAWGNRERANRQHIPERTEYLAYHLVL